MMDEIIEKGGQQATGQDSGATDSEEKEREEIGLRQKIFELIGPWV